MRYMTATLALAFAAAPVLAQDHAVPRGGGSSGGGSSSSGAGHTSSGSSSSGGGSGSSYSGGGSSGSSSSSSGSAEHRHPRAGTGTGNRYYYGGGGYYGGGYYPGYSPWYPWYYPSGYAYGPYWGSYYYGYWPYGAYYSGYAPSYRSSNGGETGAVRVLVDPEDAKVYVDGYYAGKVDDFDGFSQRLYAARGPHEILLKRDGYRSIRYRVYVISGETIKIEHDMVKGSGEETLQDLTGGRSDAPEGRYAPEPRDREDRGNEADAEDAPPPRPGRDDADMDAGATRGTLALTVQPADASVYVDGEFRGTGRQLRTLEMTPGTHRVEVVRPGFPTFQRDVLIRAGRTESLQAVLDLRP